MTDRLSSETRSRIMRAIHSKNTKPEITIRKYLFANGYRYRVHPKTLPGKPDLVFPARRKAIFVNGCFWHQHSEPSCPIRAVPSSNQGYWMPKLARNVERDSENMNLLHELGWDILVIWECELRNQEAAFDKIEKFLQKAE
ncbi:MAG: very short patch repair endonuclease [Methylosarcina sp.]